MQRLPFSQPLAQSLQAIHAELTIQEIRTEEDQVTMVLCGHIKYSTTPALREAFQELLEEHQVATLKLELSQITFIDSEGLTLLIGLHEMCKNKNTKLVVLNPTINIVNLFTLTRLNTIIAVE